MFTFNSVFFFVLSKIQDSVDNPDVPSLSFKWASPELRAAGYRKWGMPCGGEGGRRRWGGEEEVKGGSRQGRAEVRGMVSCGVWEVMQGAARDGNRRVGMTCLCFLNAIGLGTITKHTTCQTAQGPPALSISLFPSSCNMHTDIHHMELYSWMINQMDCLGPVITFPWLSLNHFVLISEPRW